MIKNIFIFIFMAIFITACSTKEVKKVDNDYYKRANSASEKSLKELDRE